MFRNRSWFRSVLHSIVLSYCTGTNSIYSFFPSGSLILLWLLLLCVKKSLSLKPNKSTGPRNLWCDWRNTRCLKRPSCPATAWQPALRLARQQWQPRKDGTPPLTANHELARLTMAKLLSAKKQVSVSSCLKHKKVSQDKKPQTRITAYYLSLAHCSKLTTTNQIQITMRGYR